MNFYARNKKRSNCIRRKSTTFVGAEPAAWDFELNALTTAPKNQFPDRGVRGCTHYSRQVRAYLNTVMKIKFTL